MTRKISDDRWKVAQAWELDQWSSAAGSTRRGRIRGAVARTGLNRLFPSLQRLLGVGDDWNEWWEERFEHYSLVPHSLENVIELGCGPFTNIRLIRRARQMRYIHCSDPLARKYIDFRGLWLAEAYRRKEILLDDHPAETCPYATDFFDLTVLINVLDHVRDMEACLASAIRITKPGGLLILGQDLTNQEDIERMGPEDIGHPIRVTHTELDALTSPHLEFLSHKVLDRDSGRNPAAHYGTYLLIGRKRGTE